MILSYRVGLLRGLGVDRWVRLSACPALPSRLQSLPGHLRPLAILLELFLQLNDYEIRKGKKIGVTVSFNNHRLFVGNIPKNRDRDDLFEEFTRHARKSLSNS